jgi:HEAT repeat protein
MTSDEDSNSVLYALSQVNTPKAFDALAAMARDKNRPENVRLTAIQRLGETRLPNRVSQLDEIYKASSDNAKVRRQVVAALGRGKEQEVVNLLAGVASNDSDFSVRTAAISHLGQIKTPEAQKALEDFLLKKKP